ncbi:hypothetical protein AKJ09_01203 [Labilithrix luteola]|uniref:Uncharacterized protein n=1 Tax=Labilithrix luteola TaxID=1391654 RepID=A0A0K1PN49_9BACT|nr:hypothetical protein AKJ09_01203 [Labilithrix luteola]
MLAAGKRRPEGEAADEEGGMHDSNGEQRWAAMMRPRGEAGR